jgi:hypothetical protein
MPLLPRLNSRIRLICPPVYPYICPNFGWGSFVVFGPAPFMPYRLLQTFRPSVLARGAVWPDRTVFVRESFTTSVGGKHGLD